MKIDRSSRLRRDPFQIQLTPLVAHVVYILDILLWAGLAWGAVHLSNLMNIGGSERYIVFLAPVAAIASYVRHCYIKRDYRFRFTPIG